MVVVLRGWVVEVVIPDFASACWTKAIWCTFVSAAFFGVLSSALTADAVQKGRSLFAGREGERVEAGAVFDTA